MSILYKVAKINGKSSSISEAQISKDIMKLTEDENEIKFLNESTAFLSLSALNLKTKTETQENQKPSLQYYLFHPCKNLVNTIVLCFVWICMTIIYSGMTLGIEYLYFSTNSSISILIIYYLKKGITSINENFNPYVMFLLSCVSEFGGYLLGLIGSKYPRRYLFTFYLGLTALVSIPVAMINPVNDTDQISLNNIFIIIFASLGKMFTSTGVYINYYYSSTIFPTSVRNSLVSFVSSIGKIGSILAPQINLLRYLVWTQLPYYVFSVTTGIACLITNILPNDKLIVHDI